MRKPFFALLLWGAALAPIQSVEVATDTYSTSSTSHSTFVQQPDLTRKAKGYRVQVLGILRRPAGDSTVFDATVQSDVGQAELRRQVGLARQAVHTAHQQNALGVLQLLPTRLASSTAPETTSASQTSDTFSHTATSTAVTHSEGPGTIFVGVDQAETLFVPAGVTNHNTNTHTETFYNRQTTVTETTTKQAVYEVVGISGADVR
jgi:hypothetical protein